MQSRSRLTLVAADRACGVCWLTLEALEERAPHVGVDWPLLVVDGLDHFTEVQLGLLKALADRVGKLAEEEREEFTQPKETHDAIRDSPENLLPLGAILRNVGALLLSTITIPVTAFAQEWIAGLAKFFQP